MLIRTTDLNHHQLDQIKQWCETHYHCLQPYPNQSVYDLLEEVISACYRLALFNPSAHGMDGLVSFEMGYIPQQVFCHVVNDGDPKAFRSFLSQQFNALFTLLPDAEYIESKTDNPAAHKLFKAIGGTVEGDVIKVFKQDLKVLN
jgi:hypothetical protein